jgi:hypothetical protein
MMTRKHGIQSDIYEKLLLDSGAIYTDFVSIASPGTLLGATRGGAMFKRAPTYKDLPYEGIPGQVVGQKHLTGVKVSLDVSIISFDTNNLSIALPNSEVTSLDANHWQITEKEWNAETVHSLTNIAILAQLSGKSQPVVIILDNPISEKDLSFPFKDKGEAVSKWVFSAYYKESTGFDSPPWRIYWPK